MVGLLCSRYGYQHTDIAMDIVQDSFEAALQHWKFRGLPDNPPAWLMRVAINKMINRLKAETTRSKAETKHVNTETMWLKEEIKQLKKSTELPEDYLEPIAYTDEELRDSQLNLLFFFTELDTPPRTKTILTLYYLCGFGYAEIGNALLLSEAAVKKSIYRNKEVLRGFRPGRDYLPARLHTQRISPILNVLYLLFNEGYKTTRRKEGICKDLCFEAMRLAQLVLQLLEGVQTKGKQIKSERIKNEQTPKENRLQDHGSQDDQSLVASGQLNALLAMMFFNVARFPARLDANIDWINLEDQDRTLWNHALISEGFYHLRKVRHLPTGHPSTSYQSTNLHRFYLEALIASFHCSSPDFHSTAWEKIVFLYRQLEQVEPGSINYTLNRIIAESRVSGAANAIEALNRLADAVPELALADYYLCYAYLHHQLGQAAQALQFYDKALPLLSNEIDRRYIGQKKSSLL